MLGLAKAKFPLFLEYFVNYFRCLRREAYLSKLGLGIWTEKLAKPADLKCSVRFGLVLFTLNQ